MLKALTAVVAALAAALLLAPVASAIDKVNTKELRAGVTVAGIMEHEQNFQQIATTHGNRAATFPGYDASVEYVAGRLRAAGYRVSLDPFNFAQWEKNGPSTLERLSPTATVWTEDVDYIVSQFSGGGEVTGPVFVAGNTVIPPPGGAGTSVSGCDPADFNGMPAGAIALIQRGTCPFVQKYANARDAGAGAALIFNDGFAGREDPLFITAPQDMDIPAIMTSNNLGEELVAQVRAGQNPTVHVVVDATTTPITQYNVIADSRKGDPNRTIVVGAHLDSAEAGAGINDNGSGSSTILEIAEQISSLGLAPKNRLRFAFWGAEEAGLVGSTAYVDELVGNGKISELEANLNFDMVGSSNFVRFVYDGDLSNSAPPPGGAPNGSGQIEGVFARYFQSQGLAHAPTAFDGRSDYGPFIANGVPAGGLFTGAEGIKTAAQAETYGGTAGVAYDPCYHQACDTIANLSSTALDQMSDAAAHTTWTLARSKSRVTTAQTATAARAKKSRRVGRTRALKYQGPFRVR